MKKSLFFFSLSFLFFAVLIQAQDFSVKLGEIPVQAPERLESVVILKWDDGVNFNSVGLTSGGTFEVAARFPASLTGPYAGYNMTQMEIYINDLPSNCTLKIYDQGTSTSPGALLLSQDVTSSLVGVNWNLLTLSSPIAITGNDIWVGYEVTHTAATFPAGTDDGPAVVDGDWIYFNGTWQRLSLLGLNYNWNIHAYLEEGGGTTFTDDFESYVVGQQLACQNPTDWTTWSIDPCNAVEDAYISSNYAYSSAKSVVIVQNNDLVKPLGTLTTGKWYISFLFYIPTGKAGYFNTLALFAGGTSNWGMECYFDATGAGRLNAGSATPYTFTWLANTWHQVIVVVDLDLDQAEFWIGTTNPLTQIATWQWTLGANGAGSPLQLDANDFFGATATDEMYMDNYYFSDVMPAIIPVELTSFTANVNNGVVELNWETATEVNNQGFEVERRTEATEYRTIGFVEGAGTITEPRNYSFADRNVENSTYIYRLKQIDFNGTYEYSNEIEVDAIGLMSFNLEQNYPNPFNPTTNIKFSVPEAGNIKLSVYNVVGEEVAVLVNGFTEVGIFDVSFDASNLPSGVYLYKLQSANSTQTKKMMLLK
jgi:hypothetical protein